MLREALAVGLGVLLGLLLLVAPRAAVRLSVAGGPQRHRGDYGSDGEIAERWVWAVRALGGACLVVAGGLILL